MEDALSLDQLNKVIQGKESQQKGKSFEDQVEKTFKEKGILHLRIPQSSKIIRIRTVSYTHLTLPTICSV